MPLLDRSLLVLPLFIRKDSHALIALDIEMGNSSIYVETLPLTAHQSIYRLFSRYSSDSNARLYLPTRLR
jgi:hypothetical protein